MNLVDRITIRTIRFFIDFKRKPYGYPYKNIIVLNLKAIEKKRGGDMTNAKSTRSESG